MALDFGQNKEFDVARDRAKQQESANLKGQKDALARRAAQLGGGPSGAFIKQEQIAADKSAERLGDANAGIDAAQAQETRRINEIEQGQKFATSERVGSQDFAGLQAKLGREFATGEREASQAYGTGERVASQEYGTGERLGSEKFASRERYEAQNFAKSERTNSQNFAAKQSELSRKLQSSQFDKQYKQVLAAFEHEKYIDEKNLALAKRIQSSNEEPGFMDKLLNPSGHKWF